MNRIVYLDAAVESNTKHMHSQISPPLSCKTHMSHNTAGRNVMCVGNWGFI